MEARYPIYTELTELGSPLASVPAAMPFAVPGAYFNDFPSVISERIRFEENEESADIVPSFGPVEAAFTVPEGYFSGLSESILDAVKVADFEASLPKANPFQVPTGYFDQLAEGIVAAIANHDEMPAFGKLAQPFEAPAGYFDNLPAALQSRLNDEAGSVQASRIEMPARNAAPRRKTLALPVLRWAAAAALVLGIATGIERAGLPQTTPQTAKRALSSLPKDDLENYIAQNIDEFDAELLEVKAEAQAFPETTPASHLDVSEIQSFLQEEGLL